jgi:non-specific serine/threonine protein kinase/serine/threonine-protein kinase
MKDRERIIDELFAQVVELAPGERQALFTEKAAADEALLSEGVIAEVESLLRDYQSAEDESLLRQPLVSPEFVEGRGQTLAEGQEFEGYRILKLIGEGGMGEVYLAEDAELDRKVAIKLVKGGLKTREVLRRFRNERQILANLQHPNIARLFEAGATPDGLPFFVMEYIEGRPIDGYAGDHSLSVAQRLRLFQAVCSAVSYAHRSLVIHRDIKPGNILVTEEGEPKLLDFGIAKLLREADAAEQTATATLLRAMTPEYASPEQVKGEPITTATDVYSLGVLLYELLTGQRPYKLKRRSADEITRAICEQEPTKPSSRIAESKSSDAESKENSELKERTRFAIRNPKPLRGDLDNIVLKALRKEPERRYASVEQFTEDIRRHLEGLPVRARKDTFSYRASKFIKRHKIGVAAAALVLLTLAGGIIATTIEASRAQRRFNEARQLAHSILFDYHDEIAALPGSTKVREHLVKDALQYLDNLSKDVGSDVSLLRELAAGYEKVAAVQGGWVITEKGGSGSNLGDTQGALESMRKALVIRQRLVALQPRNQELQNELAYCYEGLASLHTLAGPPEKVVEYADKAISTLEASAASDPANEKLLYYLCSAYIYKAKALGNPATANLGDIKGALEFSSKGQAIIEKLAADHPTNLDYQRGIGTTYNLAGFLKSAAGDEKGALEFFLKATSIDQRLVELDPNNTVFMNELAVNVGKVGSSMMKLGDTKGALEKFKQALAIYESLIAADPNDAAMRRNAGVGYRNVGAATGIGDRAEALKNFNKALEIFAGLVAKDATNGDFRQQWAYTFLALSQFQVKATDFNAAVASAQQGIKIEEALVASAPTNVAAQNTLALLYRQLGDSAAALGAKGTKQNWSAARDAYQKALDIYQDMKSKGTLSSADAGKPDEVAAEIAKCDAALSR